MEIQDLSNLYGSIQLNPEGEFIAGTYTSFTLVYTAGIYGMDDLGGLKVQFRFACDQSPLQMKNSIKDGYTTASATNGAQVILSYGSREGERPWYKELRVRIAGQGLKQGESIIIQLGDTSKGSKGIRLQTFCETSFEFRTLVDIFSINVFIPISSPKISIISGTPEKWKAIIPTLINIKQKFDLKIRAEDKWGNPTDKATGRIHLKATHPLEGLPPAVDIKKGNFSHIIKGIHVINIDQSPKSFQESVIYIDLFDSEMKFLTRSNPLIKKSQPRFYQYWGDIHGQSEETIGTNSAETYFKFARDVAFLDIMGHQGNDFQITKELWTLLNKLSEEFHEENKFIPLFGYEYSANTALGGDHNVYFLKSDQSIHRSSHALISSKDDIQTDCLSASELFESLLADNPNAENEVIVIPHVGGRYGDLRQHYEGKIEHSIEIHSSWGTFEWLLHDAFDMGYRMGIVANSDDHKGRPGVAYPGALKFGTYGGLTCFLSPELTRRGIFASMKQRKHYATTGDRLYLEVGGLLNHECQRYSHDPATFKRDLVKIENVHEVEMGDIIGIGDNNDLELKLILKVASSSPIERIEIFNGKKLIDSIQPYLYSTSLIEKSPLSFENEFKNNKELFDGSIIKEFPRIRVKWEGAEYRARKRNAKWKGTLEFPGNGIISAQMINFWNLNAPLYCISSNKLTWNTMTSGNFQGIDILLSQPFKGKLFFHSNQATFQLNLEDISLQDTIVRIEGGIDKNVKLHRYPVNNPHSILELHDLIPISPTTHQDECIFVKINFENGHQAWSSPIYFIRE